MKAAQIMAPRKIELIDMEEPELPQDQPGMLKVRVERACLCGSDSPWFNYDHRASKSSIPTRWIRKGALDFKDPSSVYPLIPGLAVHECLGTVVASTSEKFKEGDFVLAMPQEQAGLCQTICFSETQAVALPRDAVPLEEILMTQPLGTVVWACRKLGSILDLNTVVVGSGPMGLLITHMLANLGAKTVITMDKLDYRLDAAKKMLATHTVNVDKQDPVTAVKEITGGKLADVVFEAVGHQEYDLESCMNLVDKCGTLVGFGMPDRKGYDNFPIWEMLTRNITFIGTEGPDPVPNYSLARDMIAQKRINVKPLISHVLPFQEIQKAFELFVDRKDAAIKVVLDYDSLAD